MKEATATIKAKLIELKDEVVKHYDDFKGSELEETIGKLLVASVDFIKELPGEVATPATKETPKEEPKSGIGSRLGANVKKIQEETSKGEKHYFGS